VDALVSVSKRLSVYEKQHNLTSEDFYNKYTKGEMRDDTGLIDWANEYQHYIALKLEIERILNSIAS